jgi:hypothetical protein
MLDAKQLAPDRAGQKILTGIRPEQRSESGDGPPQIERDGRLARVWRLKSRCYGLWSSL